VLLNTHDRNTTQLSCIQKRETEKDRHGEDHDYEDLDRLCKLDEPSQSLVFALLRRVVCAQILTLGVSPNSVFADETVDMRVLVGV
jgi:hypothetical protein